MFKTKGRIVLTSVTIVIFSTVYYYTPRGNLELNEVVTEAVSKPTMLYGFTVDSFDIARGKVNLNQNLSEILTQFNVSFRNLHLLSQRSKEIHDVRKLKAGAEYTIIHEKDSLRTARQFIFEPNATEYVVYNFSDSIYARVQQKLVEVVQRTLVAEINSSVYNAVLEHNSSPVLVNVLVDVFAWQVDFFRILNGDKLKVVFEEERVDGEVVGIRSIKAAYFEHWGKEYYAIPYQTADKVDYFDQKGNSLRKTFLRAPLNYSRISSRYSLRRFHPVQKRYKAHLGTDYAAPAGTPIRTVGDGVVLEARYHGANGNYVKIKHNVNYTTQYLHMSKIASGIRPGVKVKQGMMIGFVGSTGLANGSHLCFRFWKNGRQVDALKVNLPSSEGINSEELSHFMVKSDSLKSVLDSIDYLEKSLYLQ